MRKLIALALAALMILTVLPLSALAEFDSSVSGDYFIKMSENTYNLAPGATETEMVLNNETGNDRKVVHYFEVDTKNQNIEVLPGYYGIDKLDPNNLALDGIEDKAQYWKAETVTKTVAYYESLGYNVVGAMNTALAYDSNAPYGYMVMNGVVLGTPEVHKGAQTYLAIDKEGNCELRSMSTPLNGTEWNAVSANFNWIVKDGELVTKTVERTSSDASRSMIGIKADGTLVFCLVDGRNSPISTGLSNYELGEMMLSLGCVNAVNCDGGGSSTFVSKREGETANTMRSIPSDGSERATINSVILVSKAKATGEFDHAVLNTAYDYYAPGSSATMEITGVDAAGSPAELPEEGISWALSDDSFGTVANGVFTSNGKKGDVTVQMLYNGEVVGSKAVHVVDPDVFALTVDETVLPYGKEMTVDFACTYGADDWSVCVDGAYTLTLSDSSAATLNGNLLTATKDESVLGVDVTATYTPNPALTDVLKVTYGKGSEVVWDFEDGNDAGFVSFDEAKQYSLDNGIANTLVGSDPLAGQFSEQVDGSTFVTDKEKGQPVKNGNHALAWNVDNTDGGFAGWTYNVLFNIGERVVLRDVENGKNATTLGMWLYIPEGAAGLAFQSQLFVRTSTGSSGCAQAHFTFTTASGAVKNLNSCTEEDIPESRWVYATIDISGYVYVSTMDPEETASNGRSPSFIRTYIKPMVPAVHTFYIDDITLDYSSAVDDRVLPVINGITYATADEGVALDNGVTINGNTIGFSALVSDNLKLDTTSGKILVDGIEVPSAKISGKYLTCDDVTLLSGVHTVAFEVKDSLGNLARVTRTFTVAGDASIVLSGHNDSGAKPEIDSVYYVDVNAADITSVNKVTASLQLQDANTFEPQGLTVAKGFKATYTLDQVEQILHITVERNGEAVDAAATTLVSIPARLWSWDAIDHVTGKPVTPETQFASGYCPVVTVDCKVVKGLVELKGSNAMGAFGGSISVETMINDTVNPWHVHDAELTVLNKDATCTVNGYTGRTYCETCQSVIDWGTVVEATGTHNHVLENGYFNCHICGDSYAANGLVKDGDSYYCYFNGNKLFGWQTIDDTFYYFDTETGANVSGHVVINDIHYDFDEQGKLVRGSWVNAFKGWQYFNGPKNVKMGWIEVDGQWYYIDHHYRVTGYQKVPSRDSFTSGICYFDENGVFVELLNGVYNVDGTLRYYVNGMKKNAGLVEIDGALYFAGADGAIATGRTYVWNGNGILPEASYNFDEEGKLIGAASQGEIVTLNGTMYYYQNGKPAAAGLIEIDGALYFANTDGVIATGRTYVWKPNGIVAEGSYYFGANGKMIGSEQGEIAELNGVRYYCEMGLPQAAGLIELDGYYYFADVNGVIATGKKHVWKPNGIVAEDSYTFDAEGKMLGVKVVDGKEVLGQIVTEADGTLRYYEKGKAKAAGLILVDGYYYFADVNGVVITGKKYVWKTNGIVAEDSYTFDAEGKMLGVKVVDGETVLGQIVTEANGTLRYYKMGRTAMAGIVLVDGYYYFADVNGEIATGRKYVWKGNGIVAEDSYNFDAEGKMLGVKVVDGETVLGQIVTEANGTLRYYEMGRAAMAGIVLVDGYYYFADVNGEIATGRKYVWKGNGIVAENSYNFDAEGKMLGVKVVDGETVLGEIITVNGTMYYYSMGKATAAGYVKLGDDYYFADVNGVIATGRTYVWKTNGLVAEGSYEFGADGKAVNGFVTKADGIYYYEMGIKAAVGIHYIDGYFYFVQADGSLVTNQNFYVWKGNDLLLKGRYTFNELGQVTAYIG